MPQLSKPFLPRTDSRTDSTYGISSTIWAPTRRPDLTPPDCFVLKTGVFIFATCNALRRLATNIQEPYRPLSLQAIDSTIAWWKGKPAPRASALRAPWAMSPNLNLAKTLQGALRQWYLQMIEHHVPCHMPSFKTIFVKHSSVVDLLCNHKSAIES